MGCLARGPSRAQAGELGEGGKVYGDLLLCGVPFHPTVTLDRGIEGWSPDRPGWHQSLSALGRIWVPHAAWKLGAQSLLHVLGRAHYWPPPVGLGSALPLLRAFFGEQCWACLGNIFLTPSGPRLRVGSSHPVPQSCLSWCLLLLALAVKTLHGPGVTECLVPQEFALWPLDPTSISPGKP